jgi:hypothetical protein
MPEFRDFLMSKMRRHLKKSKLKAVDDLLAGGYDKRAIKHILKTLGYIDVSDKGLGFADSASQSSAELHQ